MGLVKACLRNPAMLAVALAGVLFAGIYGFATLPVQLFPNIEQPTLGIFTSWRAASPQEIESEILEPIEDVLDGLPGMEQMQANAFAGGSFFNLTFGIGTDMQQTLLDVISRLNRLPPLPADADPPQLQFGGGGNSNDVLIFYFIQKLPQTPGTPEDHEQYVKDTIFPKIKAIPGVSTVDFGNDDAGIQDREVQITVDPFQAAKYGISIPTVAGIVGRAQDISGGLVDSGRRTYTIRFKGKFQPENLSDLVLEWRDGRPVRLGDIAEVTVGLGRRDFYGIQNGNPAITMRIGRASGANVLETLTQVKRVMAELNEGELKQRGLVANQSFDPSVYILNAVNLLTGNLVLGMALAVGLLWMFLRRARATLMIASTMPVCLLGTFAILKVSGHTLNVISLAGLAFAVGMVVDAAIVVLENIMRLREEGMAPREASEQGAGSVVGALVASTATTVAVFMPVLFIQEIEGQIFADLALTIAVGVTLSLFAAITILPVAAAKWMRDPPPQTKPNPIWERITAFVMRLTDTTRRRAIVMAALIGGAVGASWLMIPSLSYLPPVQRDSVDAFLNFPPGTSLAANRDEVGREIARRLMPFLEGTREPHAKNFYVLGWPSGGNIAVRLHDDSDANLARMQKIVQSEILAGFPDMQGFANRGNLFGGLGADANIAINLQAADYTALASAAGQALTLLRQGLPGVNVNANPDPNLSSPEIAILPKDNRIQEVGWSRSQMGPIIRSLGQGLWLGEHFDGEKRLDIVLKSLPWTNPEDLAALPVATPRGGVVPLGDLVTIERTVGPGSIQRVDGRRTITLTLEPTENVPLADLINKLKTEFEPQIRELLPADGTIRYDGSADRLDESVKIMGKNFAIALVILFLLMALLFRSLWDSLLVVISIPLATVGGLTLLRLTDLVAFQPLDLLTMIGFVILLGMVVNNAILLVDQTRAAEREGMLRRDAVADSLRKRLRPIAMSTLTTVVGMLPLLIIPGDGSVIYRGIAAVIIGGLSVSTIFTLVLLPALLRMGEDGRRRVLRPVDTSARQVA